MLDQLFGNMQQQQEALQEKLATIFVESSVESGAITVKAGADLHIESIKIDTGKIDLKDSEQLEDLLLVALNEALEKAKVKAAVESNKLLEGMIPGGLGGLFGGK
jgi:nucleoid-associated protein EbfC